MPRGGHKNFRKRPGSNKNPNRNQPKWVKESDDSKNDENSEDEPMELSQYEKLLQAFKEKETEEKSNKEEMLNEEDVESNKANEKVDVDFCNDESIDIKIMENKDNIYSNDDKNDDNENDDQKNEDNKNKDIQNKDNKNKDIKNNKNKDNKKDDEEMDGNKNDGDNNDGEKNDGEKDDDEKDEDNNEDRESVKNDDSDDEDVTVSLKDPFIDHFSTMLDHPVAQQLLNKPTWTSQPLESSIMEGMTYHRSTLSKPLQDLALFNNLNPSAKSLSSVYNNIATCNKKFLPSVAAETAAPLTPSQETLFNIFDNYLDVHMCTGVQGIGDDEVKVAYCVHALRHLLKSTKLILKNNEKLKIKEVEELREQGLTKTKVLIVVPMRGHAHKIVSILIALLYSDKLHVTNKERFMQEYGCDDEGVKRGLKPDDYESTFDGNTDDNFKLGIAVRKRSLKLFTDFYNSDLIIASPLALKHVIKPNNTTTGHWDFLSSIELLVVDCMHVLQMQNWANVMLVLNHMNKRLVKNHGTDLSRVRMPYLNGWSSLYRQNILISDFQTAVFKSVFNKHCTNIQGKILIQPAILHGAISNVVSTLPQTFRKFEVAKVSDANDLRFNFFTKNILPDYLSNPSYNILLFIPSYYDFVRLRNHFNKHEISFAAISDYTDEKDVQKSRQQFFLSRVKFLLITERFHFYHRYQIKGIKHLIFYDLPLNSHFYSEFCNMMSLQTSKRASHHSCLALFCRYDLHQLTHVLATSRAQRLVSSDKTTHLFMSTDT